MKCNARFVDALHGKTYTCERDEHEVTSYPVAWISITESEHNTITATWHRVTFSAKPGDYLSWSDTADGATPHEVLATGTEVATAEELAARLVELVGPWTALGYVLSAGEGKDMSL